MNYQVYFEPDKHWWEFYKHNRFLIENKDYEVTNGRFMVKKQLRGQIQVTYKVN